MNIKHVDGFGNIEYINDGDKLWYLNNNPHRLDGPAIEWADGYKAWWVNGIRHRTDGPAIEYTDGTKEWWVNDNRYTEDQFKDIILIMWKHYHKRTK